MTEVSFQFRVDLKDAYFLVQSLSGQATFTSFIAFVWLGAGTKKFHKIIESPSYFSEENQHSNNYLLDDMLLMRQAMENTLIARDTLIFLLQNLRFVITLKIH